MIDPLAEMVALLQPSASFFKAVSGAGTWGVRRMESGQPFYFVVLEGACRLTVDGQSPITLQADDFVLIPAAYGFATSSLEPPATADFDIAPVALLHGEFRVGEQNVPADVRMLIGHCVFGSPDAALLVSLLPKLVQVRGENRLRTLVQLVGDESREQRPARDIVLARLLEVLFIEALRSTTGTGASPGLVRGLADPRLSVALRKMHEDPAHGWTVLALAREAALSRSAFFERFIRAVGIPPMEYLLGWRMALAKRLLLDNADSKTSGIAKVAARVGYSSASTFSVAFTRHVGLPPSHYVQRPNGI